MTNSRHKNIRMPTWDYAQPAVYMVTICTEHREHRLGAIDANNQVHLSLAGRMVAEEIGALENRFSQIELDTSVIMPNHVHLLLGLNLGWKRTEPLSLSRVIGALKSGTTVRYIRGVKRGYLPRFDKRLWQAGYYETIMRNERMADEYRHYIVNNPAAWEDDLEMELVPEPPMRVGSSEHER